jgi:hypothetical protein
VINLFVNQGLVIRKTELRTTASGVKYIRLNLLTKWGGVKMTPEYVAFDKTAEYIDKYVVPRRSIVTLRGHMSGGGKTYSLVADFVDDNHDRHTEVATRAVQDTMGGEEVFFVETSPEELHENSREGAE